MRSNRACTKDDVVREDSPAGLRARGCPTRAHSQRWPSSSPSVDSGVTANSRPTTAHATTTHSAPRARSNTDDDGLALRGVARPSRSRAPCRRRPPARAPTSGLVSRRFLSRARRRHVRRATECRGARIDSTRLLSSRARSCDPHFASAATTARDGERARERRVSVRITS